MSSERNGELRLGVGGVGEVQDSITLEVPGNIRYI